MHRLRVAPSREPELWQGFARMKTDHHGLSSETPAEVAARGRGQMTEGSDEHGLLA